MLLMHVRQPQDLSGVLCHVWWEDCPILDHPDVSKEKFELLCKKLQENLSSDYHANVWHNFYWLSLNRYFITSSRSVETIVTRRK